MAGLFSGDSAHLACIRSYFRYSVSNRTTHPLIARTVVLLFPDCDSLPSGVLFSTFFPPPQRGYVTISDKRARHVVAPCVLLTCSLTDHSTKLPFEAHGVQACQNSVIAFHLIFLNPRKLRRGNFCQPEKQQHS